MKQKIGFYSGTFDPIHDGHVAFAEAVLDNLQLDKIIFLPERNPRGKHNMTDVTTRAQQITAKVASNPKLTVRVLDEPTFALPATLNFLRSEYLNVDFTFLFGSDVALTMKSWSHIDLLLRHCRVAIGLRGDVLPETIEQYVSCLSPIPAYSLHATDHRHVSSSQLR